MGHVGICFCLFLKLADCYINGISITEYENVHFNWKEYLEKNDAEAVPDKAFKSVSTDLY
jgi:hypothetical protein